MTYSDYNFICKTWPKPLWICCLGQIYYYCSSIIEESTKKRVISLLSMCEEIQVYLEDGADASNAVLSMKYYPTQLIQRRSE